MNSAFSLLAMLNLIRLEDSGFAGELTSSCSLTTYCSCSVMSFFLGVILISLLELLPAPAFAPELNILAFFPAVLSEFSGLETVSLELMEF